MTRDEVIAELRAIAFLCGISAGDLKGPAAPYKQSETGRDAAIAAQKRASGLVDELEGGGDA